MVVFSLNDTHTTKIYTLSLHDALPISRFSKIVLVVTRARGEVARQIRHRAARSEEHTSELQSHSDLVCRLLLEKKKTYDNSDQAHKRMHGNDARVRIRSLQQRTVLIDR